MLRVALVSANGGAGRTSLVAALAGLLGKRGQRVLAVDFDPANMLALHLGLSPDESDGLARHDHEPGAWASAAFRNSDGVDFLPFGRVDDAGLWRLEQRLQAEPAWLAQHLDQAGLPAQALVLIDTPRLPSVYARQAIAAADVVLVVERPDLADYASLSQLRQVLAGKQAQTFYLLNHVDPTRDLQNDVLAMIRNALGDRLSPFPIHRDEAIAEAFASDLSLVEYAPHSQAAHDIQGLASWLLGQRPPQLARSS